MAVPPFTLSTYVRIFMCDVVFSKNPSWSQSSLRDRCFKGFPESGLPEKIAASL